MRDLGYSRHTGKGKQNGVVVCEDCRPMYFMGGYIFVVDVSPELYKRHEYSN